MNAMLKGSSKQRSGVVFLLLAFCVVSSNGEAREIIEAPPSVCSLVILLRKGGLVTCSGTLISPRAVVTAAHCFSGGAAEIAGNIKVKCGLIRQNSDGEGFVFSEEVTANTVRVNTEDTAATESGDDFAFLKLDRDVRTIEPMHLPSSFQQFKDEFFVPSATSSGNNELKATVECRSSGFGVSEGRGNRYFITTDQSPRSGLKAFIGDNPAKGKTFVIRSWGPDIEKLRHGDSGGAFYCRTSPSVPWKLLAVIAAGIFRGKQQTGTSLLATTASNSFLNYWSELRAKWRER